MTSTVHSTSLTGYREATFTFTKNPNYYNADAVKLDSRSSALLMSDSAAAYSAYQTGEAQMIKDVPTEEIGSLKRNFRRLSYRPGSSAPITFPSMILSISSRIPKVREALSLSLLTVITLQRLSQAAPIPQPANFIGTGVSDWDGSNWMDNANGGKTVH
jgi:oligopeptide transport system substrate-binding protein